MLVEKIEKKELKNLNFKIDKDMVTEFQYLCKKKGFKQADIIKNAISKAIEELRALEDVK